MCSSSRVANFFCRPRPVGLVASAIPARATATRRRATPPKGLGGAARTRRDLPSRSQSDNAPALDRWAFESVAGACMARACATPPQSLIKKHHASQGTRARISQAVLSSLVLVLLNG